MNTDYKKIFFDSFSGYYNYLESEILNPSWHNYFYWLIGISVFFWALEIFFPWRKKQGAFRKDFWLDAFYMFFNFFLFSLIGFYAVSNVFVNWFNNLLAGFGITNLVAVSVASLPYTMQLLIMFLLRDFIHFNIHRLLHRNNFLWQFHKVHHSVTEMGFAAHLRYHWVENIVYRTLEYIPLGMIGFGINDFIIVHLFALTIGHFNHSNIKVNLGFLKYLFNNPQMHLWHHAIDIPNNYGVNFGISLSIWDYLFKTDYIPVIDGEIPIGLENNKEMPEGFIRQALFPFTKKNLIKFKNS